MAWTGAPPRVRKNFEFWQYHLRGGRRRPRPKQSGEILSTWRKRRDDPQPNWMLAPLLFDITVGVSVGRPTDWLSDLPEPNTDTRIDAGYECNIGHTVRELC